MRVKPEQPINKRKIKNEIIVENETTNMDQTTTDITGERSNEGLAKGEVLEKCMLIDWGTS